MVSDATTSLNFHIPHSHHSMGYCGVQHGPIRVSRISAPWHQEADQCRKNDVQHRGCRRDDHGVRRALVRLLLLRSFTSRCNDLPIFNVPDFPDIPPKIIRNPILKSSICWSADNLAQSCLSEGSWEVRAWSHGFLLGVPGAVLLQVLQGLVIKPSGGERFCPLSQLCFHQHCSQTQHHNKSKSGLEALPSQQT